MRYFVTTQIQMLSFKCLGIIGKTDLFFDSFIHFRALFQVLKLSDK